MKPPPFAYLAPDSLDELTECLAQHGDDGKLIAGGQSLIPLMNLRLARPEVLIDLARVPGLETIQPNDRGCGISAMARHSDVKSNGAVRAHVPMLSYAESFVAHEAIRNRGTLVGSIAHADPAAEGPLVALTHDAEMSIRSSRGSRTVPAQDFFHGPFMTAIEPDELLESVWFAAPPPNEGWGFEQVARRHGDFAIVAVAVLLEKDGDICTRARVGAAGLADTPTRLAFVEDLLLGQSITNDLLAEVVDSVLTNVNPPNDVHAPAEYRRKLATALTQRAINKAWTRSTDDGRPETR